MNEIATALHSLLAHNIVSFTYHKVNGEIRHAKGTRNIVLAENHTSQYIARPFGEEQPNSYYDVEKMGWRSYKPENLISIDGVYAREDTDFAKKPTLPNEPPKETKKPELPKREIRISGKPTGGMDIFSFDGFSIPNEEIISSFRKAMPKFNKDIVIGAPAHSPKVGTPTATEKGIELPLNEISVEDFAKMVARYVVDEIGKRLK
jgi:hypothetical protein